MPEKKIEKLLIISNRLPVSVSKVNGKLVFKKSDGGLATGLGSIKKPTQKVWLGWPGIASEKLNNSEKKKVVSELAKYHCVPVFLSEKQVDNFYLGYSNTTIWPLFHYFTQHTEYRARYWASYQEVNAVFNRAAQKCIDKNTTIWVHDYQLMMLPQLIRKRRPQAVIGFFLHIPFPSFEIYRLLPHRASILRGILGADLIGFHTYSYTRHFLSSSLRILGYHSDLGRIQMKDRIARADAFPISIDYKKFVKTAKSSVVKKEIANLQKYYRGQKVILSLDRLDYSKGILERLKAYELFLSRNPQYHKKVVMVMIAIPSRTQVEAYKDMREEIERTVSRINGDYASVDWAPISYQYQSVPFDQLIALYRRADVALVTPIRDGMNLVAKEYVASNIDGKAVLVLSEMAGAASELPEALLVNPNSRENVAETIFRAFEMPVREQKERMKSMQKRISTYDIHKWASDFMDQLNQTGRYQQEQFHNNLTKNDQQQVLRNYRNSKAGLFLLDYDGTLTDFGAHPSHELVVPTEKVKALLKNLKRTDDDEVVIISGRSKHTLQKWFKDLPISLVAEHGAWIRVNGRWHKNYAVKPDWMAKVKPILERYVERTPGSFIEKKDSALVWHFRNVSHSLASVRQAAIRHEILRALRGTDIVVHEGSKILEIKPKSIHKGAFVAEKLMSKKWDFILAIGDDYTDEDMFDVLPEFANSIKVGFEESQAKYHVPSSENVVNLLDLLARSAAKSERGQK